MKIPKSIPALLRALEKGEDLPGLTAQEVRSLRQASGALRAWWTKAHGENVSDRMKAAAERGVKLGRPSAPDAAKETARRLVEDGWKVRDVAQLLKRDRATIYRWLADEPGRARGSSGRRRG